MSEYRLTQEIVSRSVAKNWDLAKEEWKIEDIYKGSPSSCLCGHSPIIEICILKNIKNNDEVIVGNCCVEKFLGLSSGKLFAAIERVKKNIQNPLNADVIQFAYEKGYIDDLKRKFYLETWRKKKLTEKQIRYRVVINKIILSNLSVI